MVRLRLGNELKIKNARYTAASGGGQGDLALEGFTLGFATKVRCGHLQSSVLGARISHKLLEERADGLKTRFICIRGF